MPPKKTDEQLPVTEDLPGSPESVIASVDVGKLEQDAFQRMNAAVSRLLQQGAPPHYPLVVAVEAVVNLLIEKGAFTKLEVMTKQAEFADAQFQAVISAKITQDVASGIMRPN